MEADPTRMCELLVGLGDVDLVGINDSGEGAPLGVVIGSRKPRPLCESCGGPVWSKGHRTVVLVDLPAFGRPVRLRWRKRRWTCPNPDCEIRSFIEQDPTIGPQRALLTSRAARWVTIQVGGRGRSVDEVAAELGCDWHTVNNEVVRWGEALLGADTDRIGEVGAVGIDKKRCSGGKAGGEPSSGAPLSSTWEATSRFDIVGGRTADSAASWFRSQPPEWLDGIRWAVLDMSGPYRKAYNRVLPNAVQVADPFHVIRLANQRLDEVRRRTQNETLGHRGRKDDPLYRIRRLLTAAPTRGSATAVKHGCVVSSTPVTPTGRYAQPGTRRKRYGASTGSKVRSLLSGTPSGSRTTSRTNPAHPRSTSWVAPSPAGPPRSPTGTSRR